MFKVTYILPCFAKKPVGGFRIIYEYANRLAAKGYEVNLVYPKTIMDLVPSQNMLYRQVRGYLAYLHRLAKNSLVALPDVPSWQHIDSRVRSMVVPMPTAKYVPDADVVFATTWATAEYVLKYPNSKGRKCYHYQHYETWAGPKDRVDATWRAPFKKAVISKWLIDIGNSLGAVDMFYLPNGIDFNRFKLLNPIETRSPRVSMMFSEMEWKGGKDGLKAILLAKDKFPELQAVLFGVGKRNPDIPEWIKYRQNPAQSVLVEDIYNGSSIFLCASHAEGFALPPAEAMACGCAVVTTDCGGVRDFAEDRITALISPPKSPEILAKNICTLLTDDILRIKLAKTSYDNIQQFTWERSTNLMEQFLKSCVETK